MDVTGVQIAGMLDDAFYYDGPLGDSYNPATRQHTIALWAPTALKVQLLHWSQPRGGNEEVYDMKRGTRGEWTFVRPDFWSKDCYKFRCVVLHQRLYCLGLLKPALKAQVTEAL